MTKNTNAKRIKVGKYHTDDQIEAIRFIKILIVLIILMVGIYFFTRIFVTKDLFNNENKEKTAVKGEINYNSTLIGNMLNKIEKEYYVIMYDTENINAVYYSGLISNYNRNEKPLKIYFADLNNGLNKKYVTNNIDEININTTEFDKFKVGELALIKISDGKVVLSLTDEEAIAKELEYKKLEK